MKYALQLGFLALVLFSVSAGLSVWLNQSKQPTEASAAEKTHKKGAGGDAEHSDKGDKEKGEKGHGDSKSPSKAEGGHSAAETANSEALRERLLRRSEQYEMILKDLQAQREVHDALVKQIVAELKTATSKVNELDSKAADLDKKKVDLDAAERKNIERMASLYDSMNAETAAPDSQADGGYGAARHGRQDSGPDEGTPGGPRARGTERFGAGRTNPRPDARPQGQHRRRPRRRSPGARRRCPTQPVTTTCAEPLMASPTKPAAAARSGPSPVLLGIGIIVLALGFGIPQVMPGTLPDLTQALAPSSSEAEPAAEVTEAPKLGFAVAR